MEVKGKVYEIGDTVQVTDSLKKRELIVEYIENPQYPEYLKFEAIQDRCALMDNLQVGDDVTVSFNLKGRPWTDKAGKKNYFNQLQLWRIASVSQPQAAAAVPAAAPGGIVSEADDDDMPF